MYRKPILIGVLIAALLMPVQVQAQWTVFDPANYGLQLKKQLEELNRWIATINQYTRIYENAVGQLTNLKGILRTADELLSQDKRLRSLMSNWGQVIRLTFRVKNQLANLNSTTDARVGSVRIAGQSQIENVESTTKMREFAANIYADRATAISNQQAIANNAAARINRDLAAGGVQSAYGHQVQGVRQAYQLNLDANQISLSGALKAAEIMRSSGMKAVRLDQMSQIVSTLSRDLARRTELAMTLRY